jgi:hypothetical protein
VEHHPRHRHDEDDHQDLHHDEGDRALVDVGGPDGLDPPPRHLVGVGDPRRDRPQVEQGEAEGRGQERGLEVHPDDDPEPDQVDAQRLGRRDQEGDQDEGDLEEVEEEAQDEDDRVDHQEEAELPPGKRGEQVLHPDMPVDP